MGVTYLSTLVVAAGGFLRPHRNQSTLTVLCCSH